MSLHYPNALEIGGVRYDILVCHPGEEYYPSNDGLLGETDNRRSLIWLSSNQSDEQMNATFWHEVLHTGEYLLGKPVDGEGVCNLYANIVCQVLKQL